MIASGGARGDDERGRRSSGGAAVVGRSRRGRRAERHGGGAQGLPARRRALERTRNAAGTRSLPSRVGAGAALARSGRAGAGSVPARIRSGAGAAGPLTVALELRPRGPHSLSLTARFASDATRTFRDGVLTAVLDGELVRAWQRTDGAIT